MRNNWKSLVAVGIFLAASLVGYGRLSGRVEMHQQWIAENHELPSDICVIKDWMEENRGSIREIPGIKKDLEYIIKVLDKMENRYDPIRRNGPPIP